MSADPHALPPTPDRVCSQTLVASVPSFPAKGSLGERLRRHRTESLARIRAFHAGGGAGLSTTRLVTAAADAALEALWDVLAPAHKLVGAVLVGVGGTGRREMSPDSDWDLLLLHTGRGEVASFARAFSTALWDARVHVGWSVRTLAEATGAAREDTDFRTALLDARRIAGDGRLWGRAERSVLAEQRTRDADAFVRAKAAELRARREKFGDTVFLLEPNVKQGQGGLRDLEAALWVAQVRFRARTLGQLLERGALPRHDVGEARSARDFLMRVRNAAHLATGRKEDRLTFELQASLSAELGYRNGPEGAAVERFMRHLYLAAGTLRRVSDAVLARAEEERAPRRIFRSERRVGHFKEFRGRLTVDDGTLFQRSPAEVLRLFQNAGELGLPIYSWARERIAEALPALVAARGEPEVVEALKALFLSPAGRGAVLDEMHALGVLGALVPEFGRITAHHQNDLYHVYTVDVHTLRALRRLYALRAGDLVDVEPELGRMLADLEDPLPLYLGMLLHDAGKGLGGDHSVRGRELMVTLGARLGLTPRQRAVAEFLVLHHLTMSQTAQRRDLSDPELIRWFAELCGDVEKLTALYLLTWADMSSVAPGMWNAWRAGLVHELYRKAHAVLSGKEGAERAEREAFAEAWTRRLGAEEASRLLDSLPDRYFDATPPADALRHAVLLRRARRFPIAAVLRRTLEGHAEVHVAAPDAPGLLATWSGVLAAHGLDILSARIVSTADGYALDVFEVRGRAGRPVERTRWRRARADLVAAARGKLDVPALLARRRGGKILHRALPPVATRVSVDNRASQRFTVVDVRGEDRLGLLHDLAAALAGARLEIAVAKVATEANRAIDSFYVTRRGEKLTDPGEVETVRAQLAAAVPAPTLEG
ncbi:MAG TPA: [protein-PII] uridylyltransferase [Myxococcaceae bacterium]|nr:[protein-PII] uridylyltransferase [Myxococcaceae bacterium]